jgi:hypothetical protein
MFIGLLSGTGVNRRLVFNPKPKPGPIRRSAFRLLWFRDGAKCAPESRRRQLFEMATGLKAEG